MDAINREWAAREQAAAERRARLAALGRPVRVALLGCGNANLARPAPAAQLYTGSLFRQALRSSEGRLDERYVLSALDAELEPYELALQSLRRREREAWGSRVTQHLASLYAGFDVAPTFLCGHDYAAKVRWHLPRAWTVLEPLRGLGMGPRLAMLQQLARAHDAAADATHLPAEAAFPLQQASRRCALRARGRISPAGGPSPCSQAKRTSTAKANRVRLIRSTIRHHAPAHT